MKTIAVITGASGGMGRRFAETVDTLGRFDELWVIARSRDKLEELRETAPFPVRIFAMDLTDENSFTVYAEALKQEDVLVALLVNAAGFGKFEAVMDTPLDVNLNMTELNCQAVVSLCQLTVPYMPSGGRIVNIASVAAYQPTPFISVYAATKAFVLSYSRALNRELKSRGIKVMAVCPFWTATGFFDRAVDPEKPPVVKKYVVMYTPEEIVARTWRDLKRGREVSKYGFVARFQMVLSRLLPHSLIMFGWMKQQGL